MARIPVRCKGNQNKNYDGKTWLELVQDIVEVNNVLVSGGAPPLKEGDAVKVRQIVKGGREKIWSGVIASLSAPASPGGNTVKPNAPRASRKRKQNATKQTPTKRARKPGKLYCKG